MIKWLKRQWDKGQGTFRGLQSTGNWRVLYPKGDRTVWLDYKTAKSLAEIYGGKLQHRNQVKG